MIGFTYTMKTLQDNMESSTDRIEMRNGTKIRSQEFEETAGRLGFS